MPQGALLTLGYAQDSGILRWFANFPSCAAQAHSEITSPPVCLAYLKNVVKILPFSAMLQRCPTQETQILHRLPVKRSYSALNFANNWLCDLKQNRYPHMLQPKLVIRREKTFSLCVQRFLRHPNLSWDLGRSHHQKDATKAKS